MHSVSNSDYRTLLDRVKEGLQKEGMKKVSRLVLPTPEVNFVGNRTYLRNFKEIADVIRRDPNKLLMYLARELATAASLDKEGRAIFIGRKSKDSFRVLIERYVADNVICPVCGNPDTHIERQRKISILVCEACGAKSPLKG
ncbi:MAG: translation initiation factor IF-2 subunit beta [Nitrososphaerota archaeon]|nr:translation initiation factor IF-2 subunit beta [Nitrososphaerota archaeon]